MARKNVAFNPMEKFRLDIGAVKADIKNVASKHDDFNLRLSGSESDVSHTIEELLEINKLLPQRENEEIKEVAEGQLDGTDNRGEQEEITERQFDGRQSSNDLGIGITEYRLDNSNKAGSEYKQRIPEAYESKEMRGHKDVPKIWEETYRREDEWASTENGQLDKKLKASRKHDFAKPQEIDARTLKNVLPSKFASTPYESHKKLDHDMSRHSPNGIDIIEECDTCGARFLHKPGDSYPTSMLPTENWIKNGPSKEEE